MNQKLVESLVNAVSSLPSDDYALFQSTLIGKTIQKTVGVCGGYARIRNTRIPVWTLISLQNQGTDDSELLRNFPGLTMFDLWVTRAYYQSNYTEIDDLIASHNREDEQDV